MKIALAINVAMLAAAAIGGVLTGSLALLAEAGHVLSDVGAIVLALLALLGWSLARLGRQSVPDSAPRRPRPAARPVVVEGSPS